jgi:hypothetical protein
MYIQPMLMVELRAAAMRAEGKGFQEIAEALRVPVQTARAYVQRGSLERLEKARARQRAYSTRKRRERGAVPIGEYKHPSWPVNREQELRVAWAARKPDGTPMYTGTELGRMFGCSRNAVIGKAHRLGLERRR